MYSHVTAIDAFIWGRHVGTIVPGSGSHYRFAYDMAFNVYADESDDHAKNFSFLLREGGRWQLAPAYDLTGGVPSEAPEGDARRQWTNCHALSVNGKQSDITDDDLFSVAERYGIGTAPKILRQIKEVFREPLVC